MDLVCTIIAIGTTRFWYPLNAFSSYVETVFFVALHKHHINVIVQHQAKYVHKYMTQTSVMHGFTAPQLARHQSPKHAPNSLLFVNKIFYVYVEGINSL